MAHKGFSANSGTQNDERPTTFQRQQLLADGAVAAVTGYLALAIGIDLTVGLRG